jgi:catechol 1,2-dioxygenase
MMRNVTADNLTATVLNATAAITDPRLRPHGYPIPHDGPGGELLRQLGRHPMRPAHVHFMITAPGYRPLIAQLYDSRADYLDNDAIFAVKDSLVAEFRPAAPDLGVDLHVIQHWTLHAAA